jgi:hypothetical protein
LSFYESGNREARKQMTIAQFLFRTAGGITIIAAIFFMVVSVLAASTETVGDGPSPQPCPARIGLDIGQKAAGVGSKGARSQS